MSLFDSASLVVTPNGVKEGKLYSIKPSDGSGDLSVTRATTATRVNSAGLVEVVPRNLSEYSEIFSNSYWLKTGSTITDNATAAPNGTTTADKLVENSANSTHRILINAGISVIQSSQYSISVYAKKAERDVIQIVNNQLAGAYFNLTNGAITNVSAGITASVETLSNGWYRCIISFSAVTTTERILIYLTDGTNTTYTGNGTSGVYIWGAQLESGSAKDYYPTTTRLNIPRLDYTNGSCPSILVEPQRTNLLQYSDQFDNAYWGKFLCTITANDAISPDGTQNADKIVSTLANSNNVVFRNNITGISGGIQTISFFAKAGTSSTARLQIFDLTNVFSSEYNLTNGTTANTTAGATATIKLYGNGWYRCTLTATTLAANHFFDFGIKSTAVGQFAYIYGAQFESLASYATSYIPTVAASVTRNADVISKTGISSLIGQTEGTLFLDYNLLNFLNQEVTINNVYTNSISLGFLTDTTFKFRCLFFSNSISTNLTSGTISALGNYKIAVKYKSGENKLFINGVLVASNTSTLNFTTSLNSLFLNTATAVYFGNNSKSLKSMAIWKTQLTDDECINLTTI
jgi:hypothetical protein